MYIEFCEFNCLHIAKEERGRKDLEIVGKFNETPAPEHLCVCFRRYPNCKSTFLGQVWVLVLEIWFF